MCLHMFTYVYNCRAHVKILYVSVAAIISYDGYHLGGPYRCSVFCATIAFGDALLLYSLSCFCNTTAVFN